MDKSIKKCCICSNSEIGEFIMIGDNKYHLSCIEKMQKDNQELKKQLDCALKLLAEMFPPCERDGFMDKHSDYCQLNCGVDEEVFKKCWLMYIEDKLKEVE